MYQVYVIVNKTRGYNDASGGDGGNTNGGKTFDNEWKVNISQSLIGKPQISKRRFSQEIEVEICRLYIEEEQSMYSLAKKFDCQRSVIRDMLTRNNIKFRQSTYTGHSNGKNIFSLEKELEICKVYQENKVSRTELSKQYNCGKTTIRDVLIKHDIQL